jgi:hypothetical protein
MISHKERIAVVILFIALVVFSIVFYSAMRKTYLLKKSYNTAMEAYKETNRSYPFDADAEDQLTVEQCEAFFQIQQRLSADSTLRATLSPAARMYTGRDKCHLWVIAASVHHQALLETHMSFDEYQWIATRILAALIHAADQGHQAAAKTLDNFHSYISTLHYHQPYVKKIMDSIENRLRKQSGAGIDSEINLILPLIQSYPPAPEIIHFYFFVLSQDLHLMR